MSGTTPASQEQVPPTQVDSMPSEPAKRGDLTVNEDNEVFFSQDTDGMQDGDKLTLILKQGKACWNELKEAKISTLVNTRDVSKLNKDIDVLKNNQRIITQELANTKQQVIRSHKFMNNKFDELIKDTHEALREMCNIVLWALPWAKLQEYLDPNIVNETEREKRAISELAFAMVKEKLKYIEEIDLKAAKLPNKPNDEAGTFRMIIKFAGQDDANKFRLRMVASGVTTLRQGLSKLTRDLCTRTIKLAEHMNKQEPEESEVFYKARYKFSIATHTKSDPDVVHTVESDINPSAKYAGCHLTKGVITHAFDKHQEENGQPLESNEPQTDSGADMEITEESRGTSTDTSTTSKRSRPDDSSDDEVQLLSKKIRDESYRGNGKPHRKPFRKRGSFFGHFGRSGGGRGRGHYQHNNYYDDQYYDQPPRGGRGGGRGLKFNPYTHSYEPRGRGRGGPPPPAPPRTRSTTRDDGRGLTQSKIRPSLDKERLDKLKRVPSTFASLDKEYMKDALNGHSKPVLGIKIAVQQEEIEELRRKNEALEQEAKKAKLLFNGPAATKF